MIYLFLESLLHVALIYVLSDSNICGKWVIWSSEDIHRVAHRRTEQLRVMPSNKIFTTSIIANGLEPGSIGLQLMDQLRSLRHVTKETVFEVKYMAMSKLQQSMTHMIMNIGFVRGSAE